MRKRLGGQVVPPCSAHHESARVIPLGSIQAGGGVHSTGEANVVLAARACVNTPKESCIAVHRPTTCRAVLETTSRHAIASSPVPYVHVLRVTRDRWSTRVRVCERGSEGRRWCSPSTKSDPDPAAFGLRLYFFCPVKQVWYHIDIAKPDERFATCAPFPPTRTAPRGEYSVSNLYEPARAGEGGWRRCPSRGQEHSDVKPTYSPHLPVSPRPRTLLPGGDSVGCVTLRCHRRRRRRRRRRRGTVRCRDVKNRMYQLFL